MPISYCTQECGFRFRGRTRTSAWIRQVAALEGWETGAVSIVFCPDDYLLGINRQYLKHDYYTDIITFDYGEPDRKKISGDLMISIDTVRENAAGLGVPFENELQRVIIHGILHLCGHGDKSPAEQKRMRGLEDRYLTLFYESAQKPLPQGNGA